MTEKVLLCTEWSIFLSAAHGRLDLVQQLVTCGKVGLLLHGPCAHAQFAMYDTTATVRQILYAPFFSAYTSFAKDAVMLLSYRRHCHCPWTRSSSLACWYVACWQNCSMFVSPVLQLR